MPTDPLRCKFCGGRVGYCLPRCPERVANPQPDTAPEPTATQLYDAVKALRAEHGHRTLTIPEIDAVLKARAERVAAALNGAPATPAEKAVIDAAEGWSDSGFLVPLDVSKAVARLRAERNNA